MVAPSSSPGQGPLIPPEPTDGLIQRDWSRSPNAKPILYWARRLKLLTPSERGLFVVGLRLEEGDLPWIEQHGEARFDPVAPADHRDLFILAGRGGEHDGPSARSTQGTATRSTEESAAGQAEGPAGRRAPAEASKAEAGSAVWGFPEGRRVYGNVGATMDEDRWELGLMFPGFSPPICDPDLRLFFREGQIQPLRWWPAAFRVRLYYETEAWRGMIVRIAPPPPKNTPHIFLMQRNGVRFPALCYTFSPDGTIVRGRSWDDGATEFLRQVVGWLLRYLVWTRFGFFPGEGVGHDPETLLSTVAPDGPCPYHADRRYEDCCRPRHRAQVRSRKVPDPTVELHCRHGILNPRAAMRRDD